ncbi:MAG: hypothetical protein RMJ19_03030 [Gemmatales bacterium]|nr:hypothetical protein [Gemmatales bacterium]MCS7159422.1 hypothetical protein [Gemmatales bacterium]MDW8174621.1 hypothetical protein [Gemmatales bacterium]MDW8221931.1 hypothetical protein [Gemmatales bacterium]
MRWSIAGSALGGVLLGWWLHALDWHGGSVKAANDRWQEYALATGAIQAGAVGHDQDGIWILDGKRGKLYASSVSRLTGKILAWAEVDLLAEFGMRSANEARFLMTTGQVGRGASVLFVAEVTSGRLGVYSMGLAEGYNPGVIVRRHDLANFVSSGRP